MAGFVPYLSDQSGIVNGYIAHVDSTIDFIDTAAHYRYVVHSYPITDYSRNIVEQDVNNSLRNLTQIVFYKGKYYMYEELSFICTYFLYPYYAVEYIIYVWPSFTGKEKTQR